jgi:hypothetical protein
MAKAARTATASEDDQRAEAADHVRAATGAEDAIAESASAVDVPATRKGEGRDMAEGAAAAVGPAADLLALAQKLHEEYVAEGKDTRERLITGRGSHTMTRLLPKPQRSMKRFSLTVRLSTTSWCPSARPDTRPSWPTRTC